MGFDTSRQTVGKIKSLKGEWVIDKLKKNAVSDGKCSKNRTTQIIVKEYFSKHGKTLEELLTDVMLEKAKQVTA